MCSDELRERRKGKRREQAAAQLTKERKVQGANNRVSAQKSDFWYRPCSGWWLSSPMFACERAVESLSGGQGQNWSRYGSTSLGCA